MLFLKERAAVILMSMLASTLGMSMTKVRTGTDEDSLPTTVIPKSYDLKLQPSLNEKYFNGSVSINIICQESTDKIILHAHPELQIETNSVRLISEGNQSSVVTSITRNDEDWTITFALESPMNIGQSYHLYIEFKGITHQRYWLGDGSNGGLFKVTDRRRRSFLITKMMLNNTGRLFPCLDNLPFKAIFKISVARPHNMTALSIMPVESSEPSEAENLVWDHFYPTPPISTMSLILLVAELTKTETINVTTRQGSYSLTLYTDKLLNSSTETMDLMQKISEILETIEEMFDVPYPLPKLDIFLLPDSYTSFIEHNMGVLMILNDVPNNTIRRMIPQILEQWLVHAVTYKSWDNYNVTKMLSAFYLNKLYGNMKNDRVWTEMSGMYIQPHTYLMVRNSYLEGFSNYVEQRSPFWRITTVWFLEMVESVISEQTFRKAMKTFLTDNMYKTIDENSLWKPISSQAWQDKTLPPDVSAEVLSNSWLKKRYAGIPLLTVTRNYKENTALLEQHLYVGNATRINPPNLTEEETGLLWWIPISYVTPSNLEPSSTGPSTWMKEEKQISISNLPDLNSFIIINPSDSGMFLVNYDERNWNLITDSMASAENKIPLETCRKVLQDTFILAYGGTLSYATAFNASLFLLRSTDVIAWTSFLTLLSESFHLSYGWTPIENDINKYLRVMVGGFLEKHNESSRVRSPRNDYALDMAKYKLLRIGYQPYINITHGDSGIMSNMTTYPFEDSNSGLTIFCPEFMKDSSHILDENILELEDYITKVGYYEHHFFQKSLAQCPGYDSLVERVLNMILQRNDVSNSVWNCLIDVITNREDSLIKTMNFYMKNIDQLSDNSKFPLDSTLSIFVLKIRSEELLNKMIDFQQKRLENNKYLIFNTIPQAKYNVQWYKQNAPCLEKWIKEVLPGFLAQM